MNSRSNILVLHTHDAGRFIQPFGYAMETPNLQSLAEQGNLFRNCHAAGPTSAPSRAAMWTGSYPHNNGMFGLSHREAGGYTGRPGTLDPGRLKEKIVAQEWNQNISWRGW